MDKLSDSINGNESIKGHKSVRVGKLNTCIYDCSVEKISPIGYTNKKNKDSKRNYQNEMQ